VEKLKYSYKTPGSAVHDSICICSELKKGEKVISAKKNHLCVALISVLARLSGNSFFLRVVT
jgi:hypothetical protein